MRDRTETGFWLGVVAVLAAVFLLWMNSIAEDRRKARLWDLVSQCAVAEPYDVCVERWTRPSGD